VNFEQGGQHSPEPFLFVKIYKDAKCTLIMAEIDVSNWVDNVEIDLIGIVPKIVSSLPQPLIDKIEGLIVLFKVIGILLIIYFVYLFIQAILNIKRYRRLKRIEEKVDLLLGRNRVSSGDKGDKKRNKKKN